MKNMLAVAKRIVLQLGMDRRTLALMLFAPIGIMSIIWVVLNGAPSRPILVVSGFPPAALETMARSADIVEAGRDEALVLLESGEADALLELGAGGLEVTVDGADPSITRLVARFLSDASGAAADRLGAPAAPRLTFLHGEPDGTTFDYMAPLMMGFIVFFLVFILSGVSFLRERLTGTLERTLATPISRLELVAGYMLGFGLFAMLQTSLLQWFVIEVLKARSQGAFLDALAVNASLALVALSLGSLVSSFAENEFQVFQFIPLVIVPQILFSGMFNLREAPAWVGWLGKAFPLTYGGEALRDVMIRGKGLGEVLPSLGATLAFGILFVLLNAVALKKRA